MGVVDVRRLFVEPVESTISDVLDSCWPDDECECDPLVYFSLNVQLIYISLKLTGSDMNA